MTSMLGNEMEGMTMMKKSERTIELYKKVGAEMKLFRALAGLLAIDISHVLLASDSDKFMRTLQRIDEARSRAEDNMFHDHPELSNDYLAVFYGTTSGKPMNAVDEEVMALAKEIRNGLLQ